MAVVMARVLGWLACRARPPRPLPGHPSGATVVAAPAPAAGVRQLSAGDAWDRGLAELLDTGTAPEDDCAAADEVADALGEHSDAMMLLTFRAALSQHEELARLIRAEFTATQQACTAAHMLTRAQAYARCRGQLPAATPAFDSTSGPRRQLSLKGPGGRPATLVSAITQATVRARAHLATYETSVHSARVASLCHGKAVEGRAFRFDRGRLEEECRRLKCNSDAVQSALADLVALVAELDVLDLPSLSRG